MGPISLLSVGPVGIALDGNMNLPCNYGVWTGVGVVCACVCLLVRDCRGTFKLEGSRTNQFCARCHLGLCSLVHNPFCIFQAWSGPRVVGSKDFSINGGIHLETAS